MSTEENNKALVRRLYEAQTKGDLDTLRELLAPAYSTITCAPDKSQGVRASCGQLPRIMQPTPTSNTSSLSRWQPKAAGW